MYAAIIDLDNASIKVVEAVEGYNTVRAVWFEVLISLPDHYDISFCLGEWLYENLESGHLDTIMALDLHKY